MRLVLKENKQKELIDEEKQKLNLSLPKLARRLEIKLGKMNAYYFDNILLPEKIFNKFLLHPKYEQYIVEKKDDNWGKSKGGKNSSGGNIKNITYPEESEELAEFIGIMLGDGNVTKIKKHKIGVYQIRIVGDSRHDYEYLTNFVKPLVEKLFQIEVNMYKIKNHNGLNLNASGLKLVEFLESKGLKPGNKITNQLKIPAWIKNNPTYLKSCLRGLYDTDGSVYKLTNQNSYQFSFRNYNSTLIKQARESLISLGINCSNITKGNEITITKKSELQKFVNIVGFSNPKHLLKIKKISF